MNKAAFSDNMPNDEREEHADSSQSVTRIIVILIAGLSIILLVVALKPEERFSQGDVHPAVGQPMQDFELTPLLGDGQQASLNSFKGQVVMINFWGTWCGPCRIEFPHLVELNDRLKNDDRFRFVPVACGPGGMDVEVEYLKSTVESYLTTLETDLDVYSDPGVGARRALVGSAKLSGFSFPTTVLLDAEGTIQGLWEGYRPGLEKEMEATIKALLKS